jgi:hypothetical protein
MRLFRTLCVVLFSSTCISQCLGQVTAASASAAPTQGTSPIESQIIAYKVLAQLAKRLAGTVTDSNCMPGPPVTCNPILLSDTSTLFEMSSYVTFEEVVNKLKDGYDELSGTPAAHAFADTTQSVASLITAIKSSAVYTNSNFQPTPQSFLAVLNQDLLNNKVALRTSTLPGDQSSATLDLQADLKRVFTAQAKVEAIDPAKLSTEAKSNLAELDKQLLALQASLSTASADGTLWLSLVKGRALTKSLGSNYTVLTVSLDAAGGDSKVTHFGLYEILLPTPAPSYNGGAAISYTLSKPTGDLISADMLVGMYDFEKLQGRKLDGKYRSVDPIRSLPLSK